MGVNTRKWESLREVICLKSHSQQEEEPGLESRNYSEFEH